MTWKTVGLIGAGLNVIGALLFVVVISPGRKRYEHMTGAHLDHNPPMEHFLKDQTRAGAVVLIGTTLAAARRDLLDRIASPGMSGCAVVGPS